MFRSYIRIAIRNLQRQKVIAFINVFGLSVGIACVSLLMLFVANELSFDKMHKNGPDIYRLYTLWDKSLNANQTNPQPQLAYTDFSGPGSLTLGEAMKKDLPDVKNYTRLQLPWGENLIRTGKKVVLVSFGYADQSIFSVFNFPLLYGNMISAFHNPNDIVLTESRAIDLFGTSDVVGKTVEIQVGTTFHPFKISAVAKDMPANSTVRFDVLGNFLFIKDMNQDNLMVGSNWHPTVRQTYVQLKPGSKLPDDAKKLAAFLNAFYPNMIADMGIVNWKGKDLPVKLILQPFFSIHTDIGFHGYAFIDYAVIDPKTIGILLAIAAGILIIACINFTTLAIGRSAGRSKEVGLRKVIGAGKRQIVFQFLSEAMLLSIISTFLGLVMAKMVLPWFNQLSGRDLSFSFFFHSQIILSLLGLVFIVGLLAGSYPALVLSGFKPIEVLKNKVRVGGSNLFTKSLVTFQFALSIILIISTIIILQQTKYMINKNPGFNKENVIAVDASETDPNKTFPLFKQTLLRHHDIVGVASATAGIGEGREFLGYSDLDRSAAINVIDDDYIKVLNMQLIAGKNFEPGLEIDTVQQPMIINETMMHSLGWNLQNVIGRKLKNFQHRDALIIGVVKDFNYRPLKEGIKDQAFITSADKGFINFYVRINAGDPAATIAIIQKAWDKVMPGIPMKYSFLDEDVNNYYKDEQKWSSIVGWAGGISVCLACLGLLGLASLAAINRTKEIGIRKVLGATVANIIALISRDFLQLIVVSFFIASPLAWFFMNRWLQDYTYRISISWSVFLFVGLFAAATALIAISFQAIKAAIANPVNSLRSE